MLVSHDVQLNSKSIIENRFGQLPCRHRERVCVCVCVHVSDACPRCASIPPSLEGTQLQGGCVSTAKPDQ